MANVIVYHHVQGLTPGVIGWADHLRDAGHTVTTPDLFDGLVFDSIDGGIEHAEATGFMSLIDRGVAAASRAPIGTVVAGFSLGALIAHKLAQTSPDIGAGLLFHHGDVAWDMFGDSWPSGVDVQLHINEADEFCDVDIVTAFADAVSSTASGELFLYPGTSHLFVDSSVSDHEPDNAALATERALAFLRVVEQC